MKFIFDAGKQYQLDAIHAVTDLFIGQPQEVSSTYKLLENEELLQGQLDIGINTEVGAVGNSLLISPDVILENLQKVQDRNGLEVSSNLVDGLQFDIEMETGTGKTYVYLRTIFELARRYSFKKFIILVPSVAIREGVNTSIGLMRDHFKSLYPDQPFDSMVYSGKNPEHVRAFATSNAVQIMIMTIDSIRGDNNTRIFHQQRDRLNGLKPIEFLQAVDPIVIMDEPQNMETDLSNSAIDDMRPACILRYSATHRVKRNLVYRLDPVDAHEHGLVKQIVVAEAVQDGALTTPYFKLLSVKSTPPWKARLELLVLQDDGTVKKKPKWVGKDVDLESITKNAAYSGNWRINEITSQPEAIELTNYGWLRVGEEIGGVSDDVYREMIRETIREHFRKEMQVRGHGIKVLSLFFIDKVVNYLGSGRNNEDANGKFIEWFEQLLDEERAKNPEWAQLLPYPAREVRSGYFSQMSKGKGSNKVTSFLDTSGETQKDNDSYELIMKDKGRLLSFGEPVRFIFSHSALREGWDNPNVFQICTLREMNSETERRQTIGRGLRLPVNQNGERVSDRGLAQLTVIANESYRDFAAALQDEYRRASVDIGYVRKSEFAKIPTVVDGQERPLGYTASVQIWEHLSKHNFIDEHGAVQPIFQPEHIGFSLVLPEKYANHEHEVVDIIQKCNIGHMVKPKPKRIIRKLNKEIYRTREFEKFWEKITQRTTYLVQINRKELLENILAAIKIAPRIEPIRIRVSRAGMQITRGGAISSELGSRASEISRSYPLPDIITELQEATSLTRQTIVDVLLQSGRLQEFIANPHEFMAMVKKAIMTQLSHILVEGVQYEKISGFIYELRELQADGLKEKDRFIDQLYAVKNTQKTDFDYIVYDSSVERQFAEYLDNREDVKLFMKLPHKFKIDTPVGPYNPDWAIVKVEDGEERFYMIRETKSTDDPMQRRPDENAKINAAHKHFAAIDVEYEVCTPGKWNV